jgi:hypothetical protein
MNSCTGGMHLVSSRQELAKQSIYFAIKFLASDQYNLKG